jgi:hypothetical protein
MSTMESKFHLNQRVNVALILANLLGACVYVFRASNGWAIPEEHCEIPVTGEPFVWFAAILPVIVIFTLTNLTWAAFIFRSRDWRAASFSLPAACAWLVAIVIDHMHHC